MALNRLSFVRWESIGNKTDLCHKFKNIYRHFKKFAYPVPSWHRLLNYVRLCWLIYTVNPPQMSRLVKQNQDGESLLSGFLMRSDMCLNTFTHSDVSAQVCCVSPHAGTPETKLLLSVTYLARSGPRMSVLSEHEL